MLEIPLSQGQSVHVDDADYALLSDAKWSYRPERDGRQGYAVRHVKVDGKDRLCYLHRLLMQPPPGYEVIFLNHDRLDCRRENLRVVTKTETRQHHRVRADSKSQAKGVRYDTVSDTWSAVVYRGGRCRTIGTFHSEAAAIDAYESELVRESPELHRAPERVKRSSDPTPERRDPGAAEASEG
jgi:hypothetical protein